MTGARHSGMTTAQAAFAGTGAYVNTQQVAKVLGVTDKTVRSECRKGVIRALKFGGTWLIDRDALVEWLDEQSERGTGESVASYSVDLSDLLGPSPAPATRRTTGNGGKGRRQ